MAMINSKQRQKNELYWFARAAEHSDIYLADAEKVADTLGLAYFNASKQLEKAAQNIFKNFQTAFNLSEAEARQLLKKYYGEKPSKAIANAINSITDEEQKLRLQAELSAPAYQYRIKRLDTLAAEGKKLCETLYKVEVATNTAFLATEYEKAYNLCTFDIQKGTGVSVAFEHVPKSRIDQVLKTNWSGKHFSARVWDNTQELAQELNRVMTESFMTGESGYKTAQKIQERFGVGAYNARRLVRTENTYITGQAELESYEKSKIKEYKYAALIDKRTSKICRELDGKIFPLSEAQAGKNYPPMHPFCRSSSIPIVPTYEELVAKEKKILEQIPDDMTFDEWLDSLEPTNDGMLEFKPKKKGKSVDISGEGIVPDDAKTMQSDDWRACVRERRQRFRDRKVEPSEVVIDLSNMNNRELAEWSSTNLKTHIGDLQGVNNEFAKEAIEAIRDFEIKMEGTVEGLSVKFGGVKSGAYAHYDSKTNTIFLKKTGSLAKVDEQMRKTNEKAIQKRGKPWNAVPTYKGSVFHELGHAVDHSANQSLSASLARSRELEIKSKQISVYAGNSGALGAPRTSEAWAENFSAYMSGGSYAKKVSNEVTSIIDDFFKKKSIDKTVKSDIINKKVSDRIINIHNETDNVFEFVDIENEMMSSPVGKDIAIYIENEGISITVNYDLNVADGLCGEILGKEVTVYGANHRSVKEVVDTIVHEVAHRKYNWNSTQEDEINCRILEILRTKDSISETEISRIVDFVRENYSDIPEGELYGY